MSTIDGPARRRGEARSAVVWDALVPLLESSESAIIDIGGGTGGFAVRLAELGHQVRVIDPSPDALAAADRRAAERGVAHLVRGVQGDLADLADLVEPGSADLVLCHAVLGLVEDPAGAVRDLADALAPGGRLSLVVDQTHAAVLAHARAGRLVQAREVLESGDPDVHRFTVQEARSLVEGAGLAVESVHGVRVFADLVPPALLEGETSELESLLALEREVAPREEFYALATQLHLLARRG